MSWIHLQKSDKLMLGCLVVAGVLAMIVLSLTASEPTRGGGWLSSPSSFHNDESGAKALYLTLRQSGYKVARFRRMIDQQNLRPLASLVLMMGDLPTTPLEPAEQEALLNWVQAGGALLLAPGRGDFKQWFNYAIIEKPVIPLPKGPVEPKSIIKEIEDLPEPPIPDPNAAPADREKSIDHLFDALKDIHKPTRRAKAGPELKTGHPIAAGLNVISTRPKARLDAQTPLAGPLMDDDYTVFWSDGDGLAGAVIEHGQGRIFFLGDSYPLSNIGLSQDDNALLAANLAAGLTGNPGGGEIAFDEFHLGYPHRDVSGVAIVKLALGGPWGWAIIQLLAAGSLWLLADMVRFGRPRPMPLPPRRRHGEYIRAAARLLDISNATSMAWGQIAAHYRPLLCRWTNMNADIEDQALAAEVKRRTGVDILPGLLAAPARGRTDATMGTGQPGKDQLVQWTGRMQRALEMLQHGTDASFSNRRRPS